MATLNTLRTKFGLVLSILIGLVLVAFILGDQLSMQNRGAQMPEDTTVMTVNGEEVKASKYATYLEMYRDANLAEDAKSDYAMQAAIFNLYTRPALEAVGLGVAEGDIKAYAKVFSEEAAAMYQMYGWPADQIKGMIQNQWVANLPTLDMSLSYEKFTEVYTAGNYVNRLEIEETLRNANFTFDGRYVMVPYKSMPEVEVTEAEVDAYYEANKAENKNYGARTLRYVTFEIAPTADDKAAIEEQVMSVDKAVKAAKGDSNAIKQAVRAIGGKSDTYKLFSALDAKVADAVKAGKHYGPVFEDNTWTANYIVSDVKAASSYEFEVATVDNVVEANELVAALKAVGGDFTKLEEAVETSTDSREMVRMSESEAKNFIGTKVGDVVVISYNHKPAVAKITKLGDTDRFVLTADVSKSVKASEKTNNDIVKSVEAFMAAAGDNADSFNEAANNAQYQVLVSTANRNDYVAMQGRERSVRGIDNSRQIAIWAYDAEVGAKKYFYGENVIYVVMVASIDENKYEFKNDAAIEVRLKRDKQYEAIASQLAMGAAIEGAVEGKFSNVKYTDNMVDGKWEAALVGAITRSRETGVETKVKGNNAAYVFVVDTINGELDPTTFDAERTPEMTQRESMMKRVAVETMTKKASIEDLRGEGEI
ncbi:MAG: peptidyl-prolyl cis-trans isomerase [Alistipes sp.]|nr:peptidyl-prolyl cis-trans isomerase [Alistipes sp.]